MKKHRAANRPGYALLLMLLLAVVIGFLLAYNPGSLLFQKEAQKDPSGDILPWKEENRLVSRSKEVPRPSAAQPSLAKPLTYKTDVAEGNEPRGEIVLIIDEDGRIRGNWSGDYRKGPDATFSVLSAGFEGNIDPSKIFRGATRPDASQLFFIAKGGYVLLGDNRKTNEAPQQKGAIYVTGWLSPDYKITGKITLTTDKNKFQIFTWQAEKPQPSAFGL